LITLLAEKKAVLVDIRFPEETKAWKMGFGLYNGCSLLIKGQKQ